MSNFIKIILFLPVLLACNKGDYSEADNTTNEAVDQHAKLAANGEPNAMHFSSPDKSVETPLKQEAKLMKEGSMGCELNDYYKNKLKITQLFDKYGAYLGSESELKEPYRISNDLVIRVPNDQFDALLNAIGEIAKNVDYKRVNALDVTEEYMDIEARIKTKKEVEKRYVEFLSRAKNIEEVLKVENELRIIREEIEAKEGRLKFLKDRVSYSTINLNLYQNLDYTGSISKKPGFFNKVSEALSYGWKGILSFIVALFYLWPVWLIGGASFFFWWRRKKKE